MLTTVPYSELSGQRNIERDAVHITAHLMSKLAHHPHILKSISSHYQLHEPLSDTMVKNVIDGTVHMYA